ncbi:MAG TPA: hypothetical protein VFE59_28465, partial [Trebonia sp.]|nr:hypothetical protein [Trebonia sp.]
IAEQFGPRLWSLRLLVLLRPDGPHIHRAVAKIATGGNPADNYWRAGNMLGAIDRSTGRIATCVRGTGTQLTRDEAHPDTGQEINGFGIPQVTGAKPRAGVALSGLAATLDEVWQVRDDGAAGDAEPGAQVVPECDAELPAGLGEPQEGVAAVAADVALGSAADLTLGHLTADVVFRAVGVQRYFGAVEYLQQFRLVGVQPLQQAIKGGDVSHPDFWTKG